MHTKSWRKKEYKKIKELISKYKIIGLGDIDSFPTSLLQKLKKKLDNVVFRVTPKSVLTRVLKDLDHKDLIEKLPNQCILILTNDEDAFSLFNIIKKSKAKTKAKAGWIAPEDIVIPEGDTGLPPGPALSGLKKIGLKAQVKGPTISIAKDKVVIKKGEEITPEVVSVLAMLDIKPILLNLEVPYIKENGLIYEKETLDVDADEIFNNLVKGIRQAINLGVEIVYPTSYTIEPLLVKARLQAQSLNSQINEDSNLKDQKEESKESSDKSKEDKSKDSNSKDQKEESKESSDKSKEDKSKDSNSKDQEEESKKEDNTKKDNQKEKKE